MADRPDLEAIAYRAMRQSDGRVQADLMALLGWIASLEVQARIRAEAEYHYVSPPPKRTYTVQAHYEYVGRGKPMPYPLEDDRC